MAYLRLRVELGDTEGRWSPPDDETDEAWHAIILETALYADLCDHFGGGFLHHSLSRSLMDARLKRSLRERTRVRMGLPPLQEEHEAVAGREPPEPAAGAPARPDVGVGPPPLGSSTVRLDIRWWHPHERVTRAVPLRTRAGWLSVEEIERAAVESGAMAQNERRGCVVVHNGTKTGPGGMFWANVEFPVMAYPADTAWDARVIARTLSGEEYVVCYRRGVDTVRDLRTSLAEIDKRPVGSVEILLDRRVLPDGDVLDLPDECYLSYKRDMRGC